MVRDLFKGLFFITMLSMAGCGEHVELHRELSEQEANELSLSWLTSRSMPKKFLLKAVCPYVSALAI